MENGFKYFVYNRNIYDKQILGIFIFRDLNFMACDYNVTFSLHKLLFGQMMIRAKTIMAL